jgi:competence protein ComEA
METQLRKIVGAGGAVLALGALAMSFNGLRADRHPQPPPAPANADRDGMLQRLPPGNAPGGAPASPPASQPAVLPRGAPAGPAAPVASPAPAGMRIHVAGAAKNPGVYNLPPGSRVQDALVAAGGPSRFADTDAINLADFVKDGERVYVPRRSAATTQTAATASTLRGGHSGGRYPAAAPAAPAPATAPAASPAGTASPAAAVAGARETHININTATAQELDDLPGVGPKTAEAIIQHRQEHGPFLRPEDIMAVRGIGPKRFEKMKDRITVQ